MTQPGKPTYRPNAFSRAAQAQVTRFGQQRPLRTGSLLISVFGDTVAPHGGVVWLGSLIGALEHFGINQRLVRTTVFRLVKDDWLQAEQIGRRSFYRLSTSGAEQFAQASARIYRAPQPSPEGQWCLALLAGVPGTERDEVRRALRQSGFAALSPGVMAHPAYANETASLSRIPAHDQLVIFHGSADDDHSPALRTLVHDAFETDALAARYRLFIDQFKPALQAARRVKTVTDTDAFVLRTLLIHEYRKVLLRDPALPASMLSKRWPATTAYALCRDLYDQLAVPAQSFIARHLESRDGPMPAADAQFFARFNER